MLPASSDLVKPNSVSSQEQTLAHFSTGVHRNKPSLILLNFYLVYSFFHLWLARTIPAIPPFTDDLLFVVLLLVSIVDLIRSRNASRRVASAIVFLAVVAFYGSYLFISALFATAPGAIWALRDSLQFAVLPVSALIAFDRLTQSKYQLLIIQRLGVVLSLFAIIGVLAPSTGYASIATSDSGPNLLRAVSTVGNPNTLAYILGLVTICYVQAHLAHLRLRHLLMIALFGTALLLTLSRSGLVLLIGSLALQCFMTALLNGDWGRFIRRGQIRKQWLVLFAGILIAAILFVLVITPLLGNLPDLILGRLSPDRLFNPSIVLAPRSDIWTTHLQTWEGNVFVGSGVGSLTQRLGRTGAASVVDSYWLLVFLEQGFVGLSLVTLIIGMLVVMVLQLARNSETRDFGIAAFVCIVYVLIAGSSATIMDVFPVNVVLWLGIGHILFRRYWHTVYGPLAKRKM